MSETAPAPVGVGYAGHSIDGFVQDLQHRGVRLLVDVRQNPVSRKPGFSRRSLEKALAAVGIGYLHLRALGNPADNRAGFADPGRRDEARARMRAYLAAPAARAALSELAEHAASCQLVVMCVEANEQDCHRSVVLDELRRELSQRGQPG